MMLGRSFPAVALMAGAAAIADPALGRSITRAEIMDRARAYAFHPWHCFAANLQASCLTSYRSDYVVGDHLGLPYKWGGFMSLHQFDEDIIDGKAAGHHQTTTVVSCTTGVDCSGLVSSAWATSQKYATHTISEVSHEIQVANLLPGDALNKAWSHVVLFASRLDDGTPVYFEASPPSTYLNWFSGWEGVDGFVPIRYDEVSGPGSDLGTMSNPIPIALWPFIDAGRDTTSAPSDLLDACGTSPTLRESGPEIVYAFVNQSPGVLTATVSDGASTDVDVHLYSDFAERDCLARHDHTLEVTLLACGTYFVVVDTFVTQAGVASPGPYTLAVSFEPLAAPCAVKPTYAFRGGPGDQCFFTHNDGLPFCNPNLGVDACLYTEDQPPVSFCSYPCTMSSQCVEDFPGGCCHEVDAGEYYCLPAMLCSSSGPDDGGPPADSGPSGGDADPGGYHGVAAGHDEDGGCGCAGGDRASLAWLGWLALVMGGLRRMGRASCIMPDVR